MRQRDRDRFLRWWYRHRVDYERLGTEMERLFDATLDPTVPSGCIYTIRARTKGEERLLEKLDPLTRTERLTAESIPSQVHDLLGVRLIGLRLNDVERIRTFIDSLEREGKLVFLQPTETKQSFILPVSPGAPVPSGIELQYTGYSSVHYQVSLGPALKPPPALAELEAEIQVRTILEEAWGEIDHKYRYELARSGVPVPEHITRGFYSFSAYLQAASLQAEYLGQASEAVEAATVPGPTPQTRSERRESIRSALESTLGFALSDRTASYAARRSESVHSVPELIHAITGAESTFRNAYGQVFARPPFQDEGDREVDVINLLNFALQSLQRGPAIAASGLRAVLEHRASRGWTYSERIALRKPASGDDDVWPQTIDFQRQRRLSLLVRPARSNTLWRFGLKFSSTDSFPQSRRSAGHALWHSAKPEREEELRWTYYSPAGTSSEETPLLLNYRGDVVTVYASASSSGLTIEVFDHRGALQLRHEYPLAFHRYAQVAAWADGFPYELSIEVRVST